MDERTTVTRAFLFTDLESSTRRWQSEVDTMGAALEVHDRCLEESIGRVGGTIVEHTATVCSPCSTTPDRHWPLP